MSSSFALRLAFALAAGLAFAARARVADLVFVSALLAFAAAADFGASAANTLLTFAGRLECHCLSLAAAISSIDRPETSV
jgi:hypothetical protein